MKRAGLLVLALLTMTSLAEAGDARLVAAKSALIAGDVDAALTALKELAVTLPEPERANAVELLGLALERKGAFAQARAQYEVFLRSYSSSESAPRVRERLKGVVAAEEAQSANKQWASTGAKSASTPASLSAAPKGSRGGMDSSLRARLKLPEEKVDLRAWNWERDGSLSQFYYRNDNFDDGHALTASDLISAGSFRAAAENGYTRVSSEMSGLNRTSIGTDGNDVPASVSRFFADIADKASGSTLRVGRQSQNANGIFGPFDGVAVKVTSSPRLAIGAVAGSPVYDREALPFDDGRYLAGISASFMPDSSPLRGSIYAVEQDVKSVTDRRAIGAELEYEKGQLAGGAFVDYDIYYKRLSGAGADVNLQAGDKIGLYGSLEFQTVPFLLTSNALIGQAEDTLPAIRQLLGEDEVARLADGRTADAIIATAGLSYDYSESWQFSVDGYFAQYGATAGSGGVAAATAGGPDIYFALMANGANQWREGDQITFGARFSDTASSTMFLAEAGYRWAASDSLRLNTRLRIGQRNKKGGEDSWLMMPEFGLRYKVSKHWTLHVDGGLRRELRPGADATDFQFAAGYVFEY